jgi:hypothetical protein
MNDINFYMHPALEWDDGWGKPLGMTGAPCGMSNCHGDFNYDTDTGCLVNVYEKCNCYHCVDNLENAGCGIYAVDITVHDSVGNVIFEDIIPYTEYKGNNYV